MLTPRDRRANEDPHADSQLTFSVSGNGQSVILGVRGEVDLARAPQLHAKLMDLVENGTRSMIVDFTQLGFIDSTGIGVLLAAHRRAEARGRTIRLVCPEGTVHRVLRLTGMASVMPIYSSLAEVLDTRPDGADTA